MKKRLPLTEPPKKLCILRLSALGDVTHVIPVVRAIQARWPQTEITWICGKLEVKLLAGLDRVRFIEFDKKQGFAAYTRLRQALKGERFDVLLHMQVALRANLASLCIAADIRLGWDAPRSRDLHGLFINHRIPAAVRQHQAQAFLSFARSLGLNMDQPVWNFPVSEQGRDFARQHVDAEKKTLLISPCSSHALRNWNVEGYARVADYAIEQLDMQVILSGGPSRLELETAQAIEARMKQLSTNLVGKDTLPQLVGLLQTVDVVLSPDSGPAHIANALGTPVIGLYACTWSKRSGPYSYLHLCIDKFETAALEFRNKPANELPWITKIEQPGVMDLISVDEVIGKLRRQMAAD
jgi:heptosyltransferase I